MSWREEVPASTASYWTRRPVSSLRMLASSLCVIAAGPVMSSGARAAIPEASAAAAGAGAVLARDVAHRTGAERVADAAAAQRVRQAVQQVVGVHVVAQQRVTQP
jgi:hypothetical protein